MRYHRSFTAKKTGFTIIEFILAAMFVVVLVAIFSKNAETKNCAREDDVPYWSWQIISDEGGNLKVEEGDTRYFNPLEFAKLLASKTTNGRMRLQYAEGDGSVYGYVIAPRAVVEYNGDEYSRYYLENGKKLMLDLLREKRNELAKEIEEIDERIKELSD